MRVARIDCNPGPDAHERLRSVFSMLIQPTATESSHVLDAIYDNTAQEFVDGGLFSQHATITDDGEAVFIQNRGTLASAIGMLQRAASGALPRGQVFYAGMWASDSDDAGLGAEFDPDGLQDALAYLGCY